MSVDPVVRAAVVADAAAVIDLDAAARAATRDQRGGEAWLHENPPIRDMPDFIERCLVGVIDDVVVGFIAWNVRLERGGVIEVVRVHVDSSARELGFGHALLAGVVDVGRRLGCSWVEGNALPGDRETKNLYERAGITARRITVCGSIDD